MKTLRTHPAMWLTLGLWLAAFLLDTGILAAKLLARGSAGLQTEDVGVPNEAPAAGPVVGPDSRVDSRPDAPVEVPAEAPSGGLGRNVEQEEDASPPRTLPVTHRVVPGETLIGVARGFLGPGADWEAIARANSIEPPYTLQVDQDVVIAGAGVVRSRTDIVLLPSVDKNSKVPRTAALVDVNPPPELAFQPLETGLRLRSPWSEAFPWSVPLAGASVFAASAIAAGTYVLATTAKRMRRRRAAVFVVWGAASAGGMFFVAGGLGALAADVLAGPVVTEALFGSAAASLTGVAAYFGGRLVARRPGAGEDATAPEVALRFAIILTALLAAAFALSMVAGWTTPALRSLALPRPF